MNAPLDGIRVLAMEQAVALPAATRQLADLGAEVIRVQAPQRARGEDGPNSLTRNKKMVGIDLGAEGGSELFLRLAAEVDVVCHNFTPRVVKKFGIDYDAVRAVNPSVIYVSVTGFGMTGPWGPRPLFGPGGEAVAGLNSLIGPAGGWPGRPGTIVYADSVCGLNAAFAVLAALDHRDRTGRGQHIDATLYETSVAQLGPVLAERGLGAEPGQNGNADSLWALHDVFDARGVDRHVAVAARADQLAAAARAIGVTRFEAEAFATALAALDAADAAERLQAEGVAAHVVSDVSDLVTDPQLWARGYFPELELDGERAPQIGIPWGGGSFVTLEPGHAVGTDNRGVLSEVAKLSDEEIDELERRGVIASVRPSPRVAAASHEKRVERGELSRVDGDPTGWRAVRDSVEQTPGGLR
jgi:crotonobetainyl-CoA:carnitine CoA-transferase CaiB-like acyl-CoA transferase